MEDFFLSWIMPFGFIFLGVYFYKVWRKPLEADASEWEKKTNNIYLGYAITATLGGIMFLIISIIHACTGWVAK
jgi:hypothetical protein